MLESIHIHTAWSHIASSARCMYEGSSLTVPIYRGVLYTSILTCPRSCFSCAWEAPKKSAERGSMSLSGHVPLAPLRLRVSEIDIELMLVPDHYCCVRTTLDINMDSSVVSSSVLFFSSTPARRKVPGNEYRLLQAAPAVPPSVEIGYDAVPSKGINRFIRGNVQFTRPQPLSVLYNRDHDRDRGDPALSTV